MAKARVLWSMLFLYPVHLIASSDLANNVRTMHPALSAVLNQAAKLTLQNENESINDLQEQCSEYAKNKPLATTPSGVEVTFDPLFVRDGSITKDSDGEMDITISWYFSHAPAAVRELAREQLDEKIKRRMQAIEQQEKDWSSWLGWAYACLARTKKINKHAEYLITLGNTKAIPLEGKVCYVNRKRYENKEEKEDDGDNVDSYIRCTLILKDDNFHLPPSVFTEILEAHIKAKAELQALKARKK